MKKYNKNGMIPRWFSNSDKVKIFMKRVGHTVNESPTIPDEDTQRLGMLLLEEEVLEFYQALSKKDIVGIADGLTDILYVVYGIGHNFGIDLDHTLEAVHDSNMSSWLMAVICHLSSVMCRSTLSNNRATASKYTRHVHEDMNDE